MAKQTTINKAKYDKTHSKPYYFKLHVTIDADVIEKLDSVESKQGYIKRLVRQDIENTCSVPVSENTMSILADEAAKTGKPVSDIVGLIINDWIIRNR